MCSSDLPIYPFTVSFPKQSTKYHRTVCAIRLVPTYAVEPKTILLWLATAIRPPQYLISSTSRDGEACSTVLFPGILHSSHNNNSSNRNSTAQHSTAQTALANSPEGGPCPSQTALHRIAAQRIASHHIIQPTHIVIAVGNKP